MSAVLPSDVLSEWSTRAYTRAGVEFRIRPLRADDRVREIAFIDSLSQRTRFLRLLAPLKFLPPHLLDQLMDIDYDRRMAFVASELRDGIEEFIGIARYGATDECGTVEMGITVTDAWQGQGVARPLLQQLIRYARSRGFRCMCGFVLPENRRMVTLAQALGFSVAYRSSEHLTYISLDLQRPMRVGELPLGGLPREPGVAGAAALAPEEPGAEGRPQGAASREHEQMLADDRGVQRTAPGPVPAPAILQTRPDARG
jgi:RimJ/RimL family protein N-acetyltransferase